MNESLTAAAFPLMLDGVEYQLTPLTDLDISELDSWVQSKMLEITTRFLNENKLNPLQADALMQAAIKAAASTSWLSGEGAKFMATLDGMSRLMWTSIKKRHPKVPFASIRTVLTNPVNLAAFNAIFRKVNRSTMGSEKKGPDQDTTTKSTSGESTNASPVSMDSPPVK